MTKKITINTILVIMTYLLPFYFLYSKKEVTISVESMAMIPLLFGGFILTYINNTYRQIDKAHKWLWVIFEIIGILGILYSAFVLILMFGLRDFSLF